MSATDAVEKQEAPREKLREKLRRMAEARLLSAVDRGEEWAIRFALHLTEGVAVDGQREMPQEDQDAVFARAGATGDL